MRYWCKTHSPEYFSKMLLRFWQKVEKNPSKCWIWKGATLNKSKYGQFKINNKNQLSHRVSWIIHYGEIPIGKDVLHKCDNPQCVNPSHLFIGSHKENMMDKTKKGRAHSKLSASDIKNIRIKISNGESMCSIAKTYKVGHHAICDIRDGITWSHIFTM